MSREQRLFEEIIAHCGLASWIGPGTVLRALTSVGVQSAEQATAADYARALPQLKARMAMYLTPTELEQHVRQIEALLHS